MKLAELERQLSGVDNINALIEKFLFIVESESGDKSQQAESKSSLVALATLLPQKAMRWKLALS